MRLRWSGVLVVVVMTGTAVAQRVERDIAYGTDPAQRLDLVTPRGTPGYSTVIFVHGGSLMSGDKADSDYGDVCAPFPAAGISCANMNYRMAPAHTWPAPAEDVAAAIAWTRANIASRGGDPGKIFLFGHSSGAMLVALVAANERYLRAHDLSLRDIRGVIPMGSIMWDDEIAKALTAHGRAHVEAGYRQRGDFAFYGSFDAYQDQWPIHHVRAGMPPVLFLIAEDEQVNPPILMTNRAFADSARTLGGIATWEVIPGRTHFSAIRRFDEPDDAAFVLVRDFVRRHSSH